MMTLPDITSKLRHLRKSSKQVFLNILLILPQLLALIATLKYLVEFFSHLFIVEMAIVKFLNQSINFDATVVYAL